MSLGRVKTWAAGDTLTAADLNAEFNNILNNPNSLLFPSTGTMDFNNVQVLNFNLERLTSTPTSTSGQNARIYWDSNADIAFVGLGTTAEFYPLGPNLGMSRVTGLTGSLISNIGSFAAGGYTLRTSLGGTVNCTATSSFSVDTQAAGPLANGRDQAGAFASTTVHFYAITTGIKSTAPAGIASSNAPPTGPTLPTSYKNWAYLASAIYTVASSAITQASFVSGGMVSYSSYANMISSGTASTVTSVGCGTRVPSLATQFLLGFRQAGGTAPAATGDYLDIDHNIGLTSSATHISIKTLSSNASVSPIVDYSRNLTALVSNVNTPPAVWYLHVMNNATSAKISIDVLGYRVPNGDA